MNIEIYQVNMDKDENRIAFTPYKFLEKEGLENSINIDLYDKVFEGNVDCDNLEEVYEMFNMHHPEGYTGRSMSVSDVVHIKDEGYFYCDSFGFCLISSTIFNKE